MKRVGLIGLVVIGVVLTGCGSKNQLVCTQEESSYGMTTTTKIVSTFEKDKISKAEIFATVKVDEKEDQEYIDSMADSLKGIYEAYEGLKGITVDQEKKKDSVTAIIRLNFKEMDEKSLDEMNMESADMTKESLKESMEKQGFTCK